MTFLKTAHFFNKRRARIYTNFNFKNISSVTCRVKVLNFNIAKEQSPKSTKVKLIVNLKQSTKSFQKRLSKCHTFRAIPHHAYRCIWCISSARSVLISCLVVRRECMKLFVENNNFWLSSHFPLDFPLTNIEN